MEKVVYKDGVEEWREDGSLAHPLSELERPHREMRAQF